MERVAALGSLVDILICGDDRWPAASAVGAHVAVEERVERSLLDRLPELLDCSADGIASRLHGQRIRAVQDFESRHRSAFEAIFAAATFAYYEAPEVVATIVSLGHPYQQIPHLTGYTMRPYDEENDRPRHGRGHFVPGDQVRRLSTTSPEMLK